MAVSSKVEEIILELTKNAGNISDALTIGIGETNVPGSSLFELNNLLTVANTGYPKFGVIETNPLGFQPSYSVSTDRYNIKISSGKIGFNGSTIDLIEQKISFTLLNSSLIPSNLQSNIFALNSDSVHLISIS